MHIGDFPYMQVSDEQTIQQVCAIVSMGFFVDSGQMVLYGFDADVEPAAPRQPSVVSPRKQLRHVMRLLMSGVFIHRPFERSHLLTSAMVVASARSTGRVLAIARGRPCASKVKSPRAVRLHQRH